MRGSLISRDTARPCVKVVQRFSVLAACTAALLPAPSGAQTWQEENTTLPAALSREGGIALEIRGGSELRFTVDPASISIGRDGVVRYVVRAVSRSGTENAVFEGVRCETGQATTYARWDSTRQQWQVPTQRDWRDLSGPAQSLVARHLANTGLCAGRAPNDSVRQILADLRLGRREVGDQR